MTFYPLHEKALSPLPPRQGKFCVLFLHLNKQTNKPWVSSDLLTAGSQEVCLRGKGVGKGGPRAPDAPKLLERGWGVGVGGGDPATCSALRTGAVAPTASAAQHARAPLALAIVVPRLLPC